MKIQNYIVSDHTGRKIELNFADWKAQSDAGQCVFQVIKDSDTKAIYRIIDIPGIKDYCGRWWWIDLSKRTISRGDDCAVQGKSVDYEEKKINIKEFTETYKIL